MFFQCEGSIDDCVNVLCPEQDTIGIASIESAEYQISDCSTFMSGVCSGYEVSLEKMALKNDLMSSLRCSKTIRAML